ncbi:MAG TPA: hypothetical protein VK612_07595 [Pyrinomonadaceae bacterium]|nr:hypothetical protein [Pyrinomonadaceae bacterium]
MISTLLLLDMGVPGGTVGVAAVFVGFFLVALAVAYIVFRLLRKTVKMAFRLAIVAVILAVAVVGIASLFYIGIGTAEKPRPTRPQR